MKDLYTRCNLISPCSNQDVLRGLNLLMHLGGCGEVRDPVSSKNVKSEAVRQRPDVCEVV